MNVTLKNIQLIHDKTIDEKRNNNNAATIVFCFPGKEFSGEFLKCWTSTIHLLLSKNIKFFITNEYSSLVHLARAKCLHGNVFNGQNQKIFNDLHYTHIMWIDSDILWNPDQIIELLNRDKDIVSGLYSNNCEQFIAYKEFDIEYFKKNGYFEPLSIKDIENEELIEVSYSGMGFMMVKKGVFESIEYPWFTSESIQISENLKDIISEDASFCNKAKNAGFKIFIDPKIEVGHEKKIIITSNRDKK